MYGKLNVYLADIDEQAEEMFSDGSRTDAERKREQYRDALMTDLYLRENIKSRPSFARKTEHSTSFSGSTYNWAIRGIETNKHTTDKYIFFISMLYKFKV